MDFSRDRLNLSVYREMCITGSVHLCKLHVLSHFWGLGPGFDPFQADLGGLGPGFGPFLADFGDPGPCFSPFRVSGPLRCYFGSEYWIILGLWGGMSNTWPYNILSFYKMFTKQL